MFFFLQNKENMASFLRKPKMNFFWKKQTNYGFFLGKATAKEIQLI